MRSYEAARKYLSILEIIAWLCVVIGVIIALAGMGGGSQFGGAATAIWAALPGIWVAIIGILGVAFVQIARATVDTAEYSQQMLQVSRDQLQISRQIEKQNKSIQQSFADQKPTPPKKTNPSQEN